MILQPPSKLSCRQAQRQLSHLRDHADDQISVFAQAHLTDCSDCRQFAEAMEISLPQPLWSGADGELAHRALRAWEQENVSVAPRSRNLWLYPGMAATAAGLVVGGIWIANRQDVRNGSGAVAPIVASGSKTTGEPVATNAATTPKATPAANTGTKVALPRQAVRPSQIVVQNPSIGREIVVPKQGMRRVPNTQQVKLVPPLVAPVDDLVFMNQNPTRSLNAWADITPDDQARLEQQIRSSLKEGDDFVRVPFPRLAALNDRRAVSDALASFRQEASVVDARLQRAVSLSAKQVPFSQFCETLTAQTGITFSADTSVADENIILFCTDCNLRDVMRQISRHFGFTWHREGTTGSYRYILSQELPAQMAEEELKNRDRAQAILALDMDMQKYRPYLQLTPDQIVEKYKADREVDIGFVKSWNAASDAEKARLKKEGKDFDSISQWLSNRRNLWENLGNEHWGAIHLYFLLTPDQRAALGRGETVQFTSVPQEGEYALSPYLEKGVRQTLRGAYYTFPKANSANPNTWGMNFMGMGVGAAAMGEAAMRIPPDDPKSDMYHVTPLSAKPGLLAVSAFLKISQRELGVFDLQAGAGAGRINKGKAEGYSSISSAVATGISPSVRTPVSKPWEGITGAVQQKLTKQTIGNVIFAATLQYSMLPLRLEDDGSLGAATDPRLSVADVWEKLHQATGQNILSDGFSRLVAPEALPSVKAKALPDVLNALCPAIGQRWRAGEGENGKPWVLARSASFFNDRSREVPRRLWEEWAAKRRDRGYSSIEELAEMASLSNAQLDSKDAQEVAVGVYGLREWQLASTPNFRKEWRFYNQLNEEQQRKIWTPTGLPFKELSQEQQEKIIKQQFPSGVPQFQRDLYVESGKFTAKYTTIPESMQVKRDAGGKPLAYNRDPLLPKDEARIVWIFSYGSEAKGGGSTYSYAP